MCRFRSAFCGCQLFWLLLAGFCLEDRQRILKFPPHIQRNTFLPNVAVPLSHNAPAISELNLSNGFFWHSGLKRPWRLVLFCISLFSIHLYLAESNAYGNVCALLSVHRFQEKERTFVRCKKGPALYALGAACSRLPPFVPTHSKIRMPMSRCCCLDHERLSLLPRFAHGGVV